MRGFNAEREQGKIERWNKRTPVGTAVNYRRDDGDSINTRTRTEAQMLSGHTAVVYLDDVRGCVSLERVSMIVPAKP